MMDNIEELKNLIIVLEDRVRELEKENNELRKQNNKLIDRLLDSQKSCGYNW